MKTIISSQLSLWQYLNLGHMKKVPRELHIPYLDVSLSKRRKVFNAPSSVSTLAREFISLNMCILVISLKYFDRFYSNRRTQSGFSGKLGLGNQLGNNFWKLWITDSIAHPGKSFTRFSRWYKVMLQMKNLLDYQERPLYRLLFYGA